jgi:hypothetical protein
MGAWHEYIEEQYIFKPPLLCSGGVPAAKTPAGIHTRRGPGFNSSPRRASVALKKNNDLKKYETPLRVSHINCRNIVFCKIN